MVYKKLDDIAEDNEAPLSIKGKTMKSDDTLEGKTLKVYWYLLTKGSRGIREIQKDLNFSSPSTVAYQIKKLMEAKIVSKDEQNDKYYVKEEVKTGILGFYIRFGYKMIPRFTIYLILHFLGIIAFMGFFIIMEVEFFSHPLSLVFLMYLIAVTIIFIFESYKIWEMKPE